MKRLPVLISFVLFLALCVSLAFWALQLFQPTPRAVTAAPAAPVAEADLRAAAGLFGGASTLAAASNFQLKGVVQARDAKDSVAILSANGKPAQSVRQGAEIAPGAVVKEVHRRYVVVSDGGVPKRVELPEIAAPSKALASPAGPAPAAQVRPTAPSQPPVPGITLGPATPIQQTANGTATAPAAANAPANPAPVPPQ